MESINILIVEDDVNISNMLVDLLTHSGYTADTAYSGTEALFCLEKKSYALILLDLMLPGMSGEEVLKSLRQTSDTLVIAVSAKDDSLGGFVSGRGQRHQCAHQQPAPEAG